MTDRPLILDQPWQIELYRLLVLKHRLRMEIRGITFGKASKTTLQAVNEVLARNEGTYPCRTRVEALNALNDYIAKKEEEAKGNA